MHIAADVPTFHVEAASWYGFDATGARVVSRVAEAHRRNLGIMSPRAAVATLQSPGRKPPTNQPPASSDAPRAGPPGGGGGRFGQVLASTEERRVSQRGRGHDSGGMWEGKFMGKRKEGGGAHGLSNKELLSSQTSNKSKPVGGWTSERGVGGGAGAGVQDGVLVFL